MIEKLFKGVFDSSITEVISVGNFMLCLAFSLVLGIIIALAYTYKSKYTKSFVITLALLPAVVCIVIMLVNGNVGAGVAVAGAFSLVRFRSVPGTAKDICVLFLTMCSGLISGMGYLGFSALFTVVMCIMFVIYNKFDFGLKKNSAIYKTLNITIPEDLDYTGIFNDIFDKYTKEYELIRVKTTNMGSMFKLTYNVTLIDEYVEKSMIDDLRCRNGNLEISLSIQQSATAEL